MNLKTIILLSAFLTRANSAFAEIPNKLHREILPNAPQVDANGDSTVTIGINLRLFRSAVVICLAFGGAFDAGAAEPLVATTSKAPTH